MTPDVIPFRDVLQPYPLQYFVDSLRLPGRRVVTAITRCWDPATIGQCRLCPRCGADKYLGVCQVVVDRKVPSEAAPLFSTHGMAWKLGSADD